MRLAIVILGGHIQGSSSALVCGLELVLRHGEVSVRVAHFPSWRGHRAFIPRARRGDVGGAGQSLGEGRTLHVRHNFQQFSTSSTSVNMLPLTFVPYHRRCGAASVPFLSSLSLPCLSLSLSLPLPSLLSAPLSFFLRHPHVLARFSQLRVKLRGVFA